jgi:hypothetical protein
VGKSEDIVYAVSLTTKEHRYRGKTSISTKMLRRVQENAVPRAAVCLETDGDRL